MNTMISFAVIESRIETEENKEKVIAFLEQLKELQELGLVRLVDGLL